NTKAYKEYYAFATGEAVPKPKASARRKRSGSDTSKTPPLATTTPKLTATAKGKQPAKSKSLSDPSEVARTETQQLKIILKRSRQQTHISQPGGSVTDEGTDRDDDKGDEGDESDEEEEDANKDKGGDERDDDEQNQETAKYDEQDNAKGGRNDEEEAESDGEDDNEEIKEEENFNPIPHTPESSKDEGDESSSVSSQFVTSMLNPTSDVGMESIFATASSSMAPLHTSTPIMTPYTIATITTISQAPIPLTLIPCEVLQNLPTFDSVFCFDDRLKSLEANFSEYRQTNPFTEAVSNISGIVHQYINQQMNEAELVKGQVKEQVSRILPRIEQSVNAQLKAEVLTRSSHSSRTSYAVAADLSEMELKKILIEKMEGNKSIQRSDEQRNLYKALVDAYEADKTILDSYGETVILKRRRDDDDDDQDERPSTGSDWGSKRQREGKDPESASAPLEAATRSAGRSTTGSKSRQVSVNKSAFAEEHVQTTSQMDEPSYLPKKPPTPYRDWNKTLPAVQGSTQIWISELANQADSCSSFNELLDTPLDFYNFIMNRLRVDTLTPKLLAGPTYELMKGSCTSLIELEYHVEEVYKATMDQLDWVNPEDYGQIKWIEDLVPTTMWIQEPINYDKHALKSETFLNVSSSTLLLLTGNLLSMYTPSGRSVLSRISRLWNGIATSIYIGFRYDPLPLIPDNRGRRVIPFANFINNDLEYLRGGAFSRKYTTLVTKTKAADYGQIKWIEDLFYAFAVNWESTLDVYSKRKISAITDLKIVEWHSYKHLYWISVRRDDEKIYKFKEGDFKRLRLQEIKDMLLLLVQGKLTNLTVEEHFAFKVSLKMFTRSIVIQRRVEDLQLGVESYQKRLNLTKPDTYRSDLNDETLNDVLTALDDRLKGIRMQYLPQTIWRKGYKDRAVTMIQAIDKMLKTRRIIRSLEKFVRGRLYEEDFRMLQRTI
nr:hypothetical protein [Tanacetum cinerariifolium]